MAFGEPTGMTATISECICERLVDRIVSGAIQPAERLDEQALADEFQVSRTSVREALRQLASTGLVEVRPHRGTMVVDIGIEQLNDMFEAMGELEALCAKLSSQRMNAIERKKIELIHRESHEMVAGGDDAAYSKANERFHDAVYDGTHNSSIKSITVNYRQRLAPFRASVFFTSHNRMQSSFQEHGEIIEAILAADPDRAHTAMRNHVASSSVNVIEYLIESRRTRDASEAAGTPSAH